MEDGEHPLLSSTRDEYHNQPHDSQILGIASYDEQDSVALSNPISYFLREFYVESKKLWYLAAPAILASGCQYSLGAITQVFAGQLGTTELAAFSVENSIVAGFGYGIMRRNKSVCFCFFAGLLSPELLHRRSTGNVRDRDSDQTMKPSTSGFRLKQRPLDSCRRIVRRRPGDQETNSSMTQKAKGLLRVYSKPLTVKDIIDNSIPCVLGVWYIMVLVLFAGYLKNAEVSVDASGICANLMGWTVNMFGYGLSAAVSVRVSNELGASHPKAARFSALVLAVTSILIGVAIGAGWQAYVAYVNLGCYYLVGIPLCLLMAFKFNMGLQVHSLLVL
ncbi:hypothetical protein C3L33_13975, partial [Rhododendron williamsianum]